jgi:thiamine pyrophosphate-dependent acetolactate synthase large subunit-like protein
MTSTLREIATTTTIFGAPWAPPLLSVWGWRRRSRKKTVLVVTGDGEQLMAFGSLATIAVAKARNLVIAVIDNGHFGETGMQMSHTGRGLNFADVAASCGFAHTATLTRIEEVNDLARLLGAAAEGPSLFVIKVTAENPPRSLPPRDAIFIKNRFRASLDLAPT